MHRTVSRRTASMTAAKLASQRSGRPVNPGFENDGAGVSNPAGWNSSGTDGAASTEAFGHTGAYMLGHSAAVAFRVETTQEVAVLTPGWYTLRVWVQRSSGENDAWIGLRDASGRTEKTWVPASQAWLQIVLSTFVSEPSCTIVLRTAADGGEWTHFDDVGFVEGESRLSILGADVSSLAKTDDLGGIYRTDSGAPGDALAILHGHGLNWIRLRAWVDSADGYHGTAELLSMARRARRLGIKVLVDLHYSDFWADPAKQWTPAAWQGMTFLELKQIMVEYTRGVVLALVAQQTPPDMIQLGNEITTGMLWDYAATRTGESTADDGYGTGTLLTVRHTENWGNLAELLTAGYDAVKSVSPATRVMLHIDAGGNNPLYRWWFDNIKDRAVPFDLIGASYYGYWHGPLADLQNNLNDVTARYGKDVVVVETAYPFTLTSSDGGPNVINDPSQLAAEYPATAAGQAANLRDVMSVVRAIPNGHGVGIFYWDATSISVKGNGWSPRDRDSGNDWENQALFDYDGRPLPAMSLFVP